MKYNFIKQSYYNFNLLLTSLSYFPFFFFLVFLGPNLRHMEVPRLGDEWEP